MAQRLGDHSLLRFDIPTASVCLHDVIRAYLAGEMADPAALHARLVDAWGDPHRLPDDYAWRRLAYHLDGAGRTGQLRDLLLDYGWIEGKLRAAGTNALLADYDRFRNDADLRLTQDVIVRAATYLEPPRPDSASYLQMFARQYGAAAFADRVGRGHPLPWSTRWAHVMPRTPHRVLGYHDGAATAITSLVLPDAGQVAVSGGADGVVRVWNLEPGGPVHEPRDIGTPVRSIRPLPRRDGQPGVLLLDQAGTCTWWGLTGSPALPLNLNGQEPCHCTAILERNGTATALLGCGSTIVEYDIERHCAVRTIDLTSCYSGRPVQVSGIAVLSGPEGDGLLVADLSGSAIAVVDLASGDTVGTLTAPGDGNRAIGSLLAAAHVGGRRVAMVKGDRDIQLWDLDPPTLIGYTMMQGVCGSGTMSDGRPIVFATDMDGMFGAWDLSDLVASCSQQRADDLTDQIFKAIPALPAGPEEGSATLSAEQLAEVIHDSPGSLAWIPTEEECPNENASALPENPGIFAISASWSLCGSKSYMGGRREVTIVIINYAFGDH